MVFSNERKHYPKVSFVILNWNGLEDTIECLESLQKITYENYEVVVVDNCSEGDDVEALQKRFGSAIRVVVNDSNYGSAEGYNSGIRYILANSQPKPDYIVIMNNDLVVDKNCLSELVNVAESDDKIGIVGPKIYYYDHKGRKDIIWSAGGKIRLWQPHVQCHIGENVPDQPKYGNLTTVDWITAALLMMRTDLTKELGLFHPGYFMGLEDTEYCLKAREQGFKIVYVPSAKAWHKVGVSIEKTNISYADPTSYYYFVKRNFSRLIYIYQLLLFPLIIIYWGLLYLIRQRDKRRPVVFLRNFTNFIFHRSSPRLKE
jgi:GT2 family glycosyltransferase